MDTCKPIAGIETCKGDSVAERRQDRIVHFKTITFSDYTITGQNFAISIYSPSPRLPFLLSPPPPMGVVSFLLIISLPRIGMKLNI